MEELDTLKIRRHTFKLQQVQSTGIWYQISYYQVSFPNTSELFVDIIWKCEDKLSNNGCLLSYVEDYLSILVWQCYNGIIIFCFLFLAVEDYFMIDWSTLMKGHARWLCSIDPVRWYYGNGPEKSVLSMQGPGGTIYQQFNNQASPFFLAVKHTIIWSLLNG